MISYPCYKYHILVTNNIQLLGMARESLFLFSFYFLHNMLLIYSTLIRCFCDMAAD